MKPVSPFRTILLIVVAAAVGLASLPLLNVQYTPAASPRSITVSYTWDNASERVMEAEVTSIIEGVLSSVSGCIGVSSVSETGKGKVKIDFRKGTDMQKARLEVATAIRNARTSLPEGVSYPEISLGTGGRGSQTAITYMIRSSLPSQEIARFVSSTITIPLSSVEGVEEVKLWGNTPFMLEVTYDADMAVRYDISADDIAAAFKSWFGTEMIGMVAAEDGLTSLKLACRRSSDIGEMPIANISGRVIRLGNIATWRYKESEPSSYYRLNGLNTLTLEVVADAGSSLLVTVNAVKKRMLDLQEYFPDEISMSVSQDATEYIRTELGKVYKRTLLCILVLLVFVLLASRSVKYLLVIAATLAVDISVSLLFYNIFGLSVHIYTLAGITVSLSLVIDASIVMADHYSYYHDRKIFGSLLGATATTLGALAIILLLPQQDRSNLEDFSKAVMINLAVSLFSAYLFIPSLIGKPSPESSHQPLSFSKRRVVVRASQMYTKYILFGRRWRWAYVLVLAAGFLLMLRPFMKAAGESDFYRTPSQRMLYIQAGMPEGCSVAQLNEVVRSMENYLSGFDGIDMFSAWVSSHDNALITVSFKPKYDDGYYPDEVKAGVTATAMNFGGANWRVWGVNDNYFDNNVGAMYAEPGILLTGYNYDMLYRYAEVLEEKLLEDHLVRSPMIMANGMASGTEYNMEHGNDLLALMGTTPYAYYSGLRTRLFGTEIGSFPLEEGMTNVALKSSGQEEFDLWNVMNSGIEADSAYVKLSGIGSVEKKPTGIPIVRKNQSYELVVGYDYIGSGILKDMLSEQLVDYMNEEVLPVGYQAEAQKPHGLDDESKKRHSSLILFVVLVIYVICAITFESLRLPFAIMLTVPVSFIGVFIAFAYSDFTFDQGGFAAFVMLCGIVVNAGIYLVGAFKSDGSGCPDERKYVKAFNHKIIPVMLTVISTILGLIPFLIEGPSEVFWFDFAVGTICGMVFSAIAILFFLPIFCVGRK